MENESLRSHSGPTQSAALLGALPGPSSDSVDVAQLLGTLRDNARLIMLIGAGVLCAVMGFCLYSHMTFGSSGQLYLGELSTRPVTREGEIDLAGSGQSD